MSRKHFKVYMDVVVGEKSGGRIIFELWNDITPRTSENFRALCAGDKGAARDSKKKLSYEGCRFFRIKRGFMCQAGDFVHNNGKGGESIYGGAFRDESYQRRHTCAGLLSMANNGRNTNTSQFFITLKATPQLDGKHVVFGHVIGGMDVVRAIEQVPVDDKDRPRVDITIVGCGDMTETQLNMGDTRLQSFTQRTGVEDYKGLKNRPLEERDSEKGVAILRGESAAFKIGEREVGVTETTGAEVPPVAFQSERERKLFELRLKMNQGRRANDAAVIEEKKRFEDPEYEKKRAAAEWKKKEEKREAEDAEEDPALRLAPKGREHLLETQELQEIRAAKKSKKGETFGWDVYFVGGILKSGTLLPQVWGFYVPSALFMVVVEVRL